MLLQYSSKYRENMDLKPLLEMYQKLRHNNFRSPIRRWVD
jgi:hypothetical protein